MNLRYVYFDVDNPSKDRATIQMLDGDDLLGAIFLRKKSNLPDDPDPHTPCWQVAGIDVIERFRRRGFGTKLYEEAARQASRHGMALCSDTAGDIANEALAFWEKQVRKGRAYWEVPGPPEEEGSNYDYGRFVLRMPLAPSLSGSGKGRKAATRQDIERHFSICMNRAIRACAKDPTLIFSGCPETSQLAWRALDNLGLGLDAVMLQGKARSWDGTWVDHVWVEVPGLGLRIETNPSQILGVPQFIMVLDLDDQADRYQDGVESMERLEQVTPEGEKFYRDLAEEVSRCVRKRSR